MESRVIELTKADIKNNKLNIRACGEDFFPKGVFGGSTKNNPGDLVTQKINGIPNPIKTDIPTDRHTNRPRWIFRRRSWLKDFVRHHNLRPGAKITIKRLDENTYQIIPGNGQCRPVGAQILFSQSHNSQANKTPNQQHTVKEIDRPTKANEVTHSTALEKLNLNWRERDLPEKERTKHVHRLHPYLGKYIPQLVEIFLRKYFAAGDTILDPFVGSGTTLVQANELGINCIGYDISAFNVLLCRVKTAHYDITQARAEVLDILKRVRTSTNPDNSKHNLFSGDDFEHIENIPRKTENRYLSEWFAPQSLVELLAYRHFLENRRYIYKDLLRVILSRAARSARLTTHFDLDFPKHPQKEPYWCYKHSRICTPVQEAYKFLHRYSLDTMRRIEQFSSIQTNASVQVFHADSRGMSIPAVNGVITSPPYVGLIDYHEQHTYSYHLLGLPKNSHSEIGSASMGRNSRAVCQYKKDIVAVFRRALEGMSQGGHLVVIAHDRGELYLEIAQTLRVEVEGVVKRHVNRRTGRRGNNFYESVFVWRKP